MTTRFLDGPAKGHGLSLARAPRFLRVVIDPAGGVDALDQLTDVMRPDEVAHVYELAADIGVGFACTRGKGCRRIAIATYRIYGRQPDQDTLRDNQLWAAWAMSQANG
ncbi:MAG: hypothetical protein WC815_24125 [Vicinamibacterales bacterium]|jgi:hypothetical protein